MKSSFSFDSEDYTLNERSKAMDTAATITGEGRTIVPLRLILQRPWKRK